MRHLFMIRFNNPFNSVAWYSASTHTIRYYKRLIGPIFILTSKKQH